MNSFEKNFRSVGALKSAIRHLEKGELRLRLPCEDISIGDQFLLRLSCELENYNQRFHCIAKWILDDGHPESVISLSVEALQDAESKSLSAKRRASGNISPAKQTTTGAKISVKDELPRRRVSLSSGPIDFDDEDGSVGLKSILVVDDNPHILELIVAGLNQQAEGLLRYNAIGVSTAKQAMQQLELCAFDVLISDIFMPATSGAALITNIRDRERKSSGSHLPIVAISAQLGQGKALAFNSGADAFIAKPFTLRSLVELIVTICESRDEFETYV